VVAYVYSEGTPAPFFKTISDLTQGTFYFVRVSAKNSQGFGSPASSTPGSLQPYEASSGPTNVHLFATSDSMITMSFNLPDNNGGDIIKSYRVEWDTNAAFNGVVSKNHKGAVELDATKFNSHTIQYLTEGRAYYVRVFAINSAGLSVPTISSPAFVRPRLQIPGLPHTILATTGLISSNSITLNWQRPRVPWHLVPCFGLVTAPHDCPVKIGGGLPSSTGGSEIMDYMIEWNEDLSFSSGSGFSRGSITTTGTTYSIPSLIAGRTYYIRISAKNAVGPGNFCSYKDANCLTHIEVASAVASY